MSSASEDPPGELNVIQPKPSEQIRRRSHRLSITNWRTNSVCARSITQVDVYLGSLTAISEQLAASLVKQSQERGAEVTMHSLEAFHPERYVDSNSPYRAPTRVAVFVVSTHVAGKPAPNAEAFLQWLREVPTAVPSSTVHHSEETLEAKAIEASAPPQSSSHDTKSPRTHRIHSEGVLQRHHSMTDAFRASFRVYWRHPFGGGDPESKPDGPLCGVQYAVFGVGNSIYRTYNATAKYVDSRLHELGAMRVCPLGLGDVSKGIEVVFAKWEAQLLQTISNSVSVSAPATAREPSSPPPRESVRCAPTSSTEISISEVVEQSIVQGSTPMHLRLPRAGLPGKQGHESPQRRYSSAYTSIIAQRGAFDQNTSMPPLTDRR